MPKEFCRVSLGPIMAHAGREDADFHKLDRLRQSGSRDVTAQVFRERDPGSRGCRIRPRASLLMQRGYH